MPHVRHKGFLIPSNMVCMLLIVLSDKCEITFPIYHYEELVDHGKIFNKRNVKFGCTQICLQKFQFHFSHLRIYLKPKYNSACEYRAYFAKAPRCYAQGTFALIIQKFTCGVARNPMTLELQCRIQMLLSGYVKRNKWSENAIENGAIALIPQYPIITRSLWKQALFPRVRPIFWLNRRHRLDSTCSIACQPSAPYHQVYHSCSSAWPGLITEVCDLNHCPFYDSYSDDDLPSPSGEPYF